MEFLFELFFEIFFEGIFTNKEIHNYPKALYYSVNTLRIISILVATFTLSVLYISVTETLFRLVIFIAFIGINVCILHIFIKGIELRNQKIKKFQNKY